VWKWGRGAGEEVRQISISSQWVVKLNVFEHNTNPQTPQKQKTTLSDEEAKDG